MQTTILFQLPEALPAVGSELTQYSVHQVLAMTRTEQNPWVTATPISL